MSKIPELAVVPNVSFIDNLTLEDIKNMWFFECHKYYIEEFGEDYSSSTAHPLNCIGMATSLLAYQILKCADCAGKVDLLKYSFGDFLDNIAALKHILRRPASGAITTLRFTVSATRTSVTGIPAHSKVTDDMGNKFQTDKYAEIPAGQEYVDIQATALVAGREANGLPVNSITNFVDPLPYIASVTNIEPSSGGDDIEGDDDLTYRVFMAPAGYSVAGPKEAYEYWARQFRTDIDDVKVYTPAPSEVVVLFMLEDGKAPSDLIASSMQNFLATAKIRPLTDFVTARAPEDVDYQIKLKYYINQSNEANAVTIQNAVNTAISDYKKWQRKIGRDIEPGELVKRIKEAGAKRVEITTPAFTKVADTQIALSGNDEINYGGLEDD